MLWPYSLCDTTVFINYNLRGKNQKCDTCRQFLTRYKWKSVFIEHFSLTLDLLVSCLFFFLLYYLPTLKVFHLNLQIYEATQGVSSSPDNNHLSMLEVYMLRHPEILKQVGMLYFLVTKYLLKPVGTHGPSLLRPWLLDLSLLRPSLEPFWRSQGDGKIK